MTADVCTYCHATRWDTTGGTPLAFYWAPGRTHAPDTCTYGLAHGWPEAPAAAPAVGVRKRDTSLCTRCGLHPRNPVAAANGCAHEYGGS
jgi:hypothetical protein